MTALDRFAIKLLLLIALLLAVWFGARHYGAVQRQAGWDAAVAAGRAEFDRQAATARKTESDLRALLRAQDATALRKEQEHAESLEAAQRRVRAGIDRLRCPAGPVPAPAPTSGGSAASGPVPDGNGAELVPDAAAALLGDGATIARIVRKFDRLQQRFEECRAVNAR